MPAPELSFVNHASFIFEYDGVRLICDPWLEGTAFNRGWRLLAPSKMRHEDFAEITHVWFSHQHPDHFSPRDIRAIAPDDRKRIVTLYQETRDKKVVRFCKALAFKDIRELPDRRWTQLTGALQVMCGKWDDRDSWLALRTPETTILNVNDCFIETQRQAEEIARCVGEVDVLMTQFSYANWAGNPGDVQHHQREAAAKLREIRLQMQILKPKTIIPFASFVWFSHEENFYHNEHMNRIGAIAQWIEEELSCAPVVLYPGDRWAIGTPHDWRTAAQRYEADFSRVLQAGPSDTSPAVPEERVRRAMNDFLKRVKSRNPAIAFVPGLRTSVYVTDLQRAFELSLDGIKDIDASATVDLQLGSDSLYFALRTPWGSNALSVNGRFSAPAGGDRERFFRFFRASDLNDHGYAFDYSWAAGQVFKQFRKRLRLQNEAAWP